MLKLLLSLTLLVNAADLAHALTLRRISFYSLSRTETDSNPAMSACGKTFRGQIGLSHDLLKVFPCGTVVKITTDSGRVFRGRVNDSMNARYTRSVDILVSSASKARHLGISKGVITKG